MWHKPAKKVEGPLFGQDTWFCSPSLLTYEFARNGRSDKGLRIGLLCGFMVEPGASRRKQEADLGISRSASIASMIYHGLQILTFNLLRTHTPSPPGPAYQPSLLSNPSPSSFPAQVLEKSSLFLDFSPAKALLSYLMKQTDAGKSGMKTSFLRAVPASSLLIYWSLCLAVVVSPRAAVEPGSPHVIGLEHGQRFSSCFSASESTHLLQKSGGSQQPAMSFLAQAPELDLNYVL
ncbi:hypothetical protein Anapl_00815 [Anas platyrhynchos]|uniref:Uncharacterized protein n=1 Tax=Anas platyrhynchos TaxID=8839 RepID=R0LX20_ANAPL|nr:hypothetical protein Anapl_00815 [Anas platyrhynchos]